jgi:hypothetical protein
VLVLVALAGVAHAQAPSPNPNAAAADAAFKQGRELLKADKYAEACVQFEKSYKLDPAFGTLANIAECSEKIGKLATAAAAFREVVAKDTNDQRKATAAERLKEINPRIAKLNVTIASPPAGLVVEIDSKFGPRKIEANQPVEVDAGDYTIIVRARGYTEFISRVKINLEGKTTSVDAALVPTTSNTDPVKHEEPETPPPTPHSKRKVFAIGALATGGALIAGGFVFGSLARSQWNEAKDICGGTVCMTHDELDRANGLRDKARTKATVATILVIGGVAVAGAGAFLLITLPRDTTVAPVATEGGAGVSLTGSF